MRFFLTAVMIGGIALMGAACKPKAEDNGADKTVAAAPAAEPQADDADATAPAAAVTEGDDVAAGIPPAPVAPVPDTAYQTFVLGESADQSTNNGCLWRMPPLLEPGVEVYAALARVEGPEGASVNLQVAGASAQNNALQPLQFTTAHLVAGDADTATMATATDPGNTIAVTLKPDALDKLVAAMAANPPQIFVQTEKQELSFKLASPTAEEVKAFTDCTAKSVPVAPVPGDPAGGAE